jgi:hypothetical protein
MFNERTHETCGEFQKRIKIAEISARVRLAHRSLKHPQIVVEHFVARSFAPTVSARCGSEK